MNTFAKPAVHGTFPARFPSEHTHTGPCVWHMDSFLAVATNGLTHTNIWQQFLISALLQATRHLPRVWQQFSSVPVVTDANSQSSHQTPLTAHDPLRKVVLGKKATLYRHHSSKLVGTVSLSFYSFIIILQLHHLFPF